MIDVNEYKWKDFKAQNIYEKGALNVAKAFMKYHIDGVQGENLNEFLALLQEGIAQIEKALKSETIPVPLPYAKLARAYTHFALLGYSDDQAGSKMRAPLFEKALDLGEMAEERYETTTGWDPGNRHDFHFALALAHFYRKDEMVEAKDQINKAKKYRCKGGGFNKLAISLEETLDEIEKEIASLGAPTSKKGGCFSVIAIIVVMTMVFVIGFLVLFD